METPQNRTLGVTNSHQCITLFGSREGDAFPVLRERQACNHALGALPQQIGRRSQCQIIARVEFIGITIRIGREVGRYIKCIGARFGMLDAVGLAIEEFFDVDTSQTGVGNLATFYGQRLLYAAFINLAIGIFDGEDKCFIGPGSDHEVEETPPIVIWIGLSPQSTVTDLDGSSPKVN